MQVPVFQVPVVLLALLAVTSTGAAYIRFPDGFQWLEIQITMSSSKGDALPVLTEVEWMQLKPLMSDKHFNRLARLLGREGSSHKTTKVDAKSNEKEGPADILEGTEGSGFSGDGIEASIDDEVVQIGSPDDDGSGQSLEGSGLGDQEIWKVSVRLYEGSGLSEGSGPGDDDEPSQKESQIDGSGSTSYEISGWNDVEGSPINSMLIGGSGSGYGSEFNDDENNNDILDSGEDLNHGLDSRHHDKLRRDLPTWLLVILPLSGVSLILLFIVSLALCCARRRQYSSIAYKSFADEGHGMYYDTQKKPIV